MEVKFQKKVEDIVNGFAYGMWDVKVSNDDGSHLVNPRPQINVEFETYTDAGQDLVFDITFDDNNDYENDFAQLVNELYDYWDDYDPDEEASLWIGEDGHGTNGAPYHIIDIVKDMQNAKELIEGLELEFARNFKEEFHRSSLEYPHGVMVKGKITHVQRGVETKGGFFEDKVVFFEATFSDGFKAEYATDAISFYANYFDQL